VQTEEFGKADALSRLIDESKRNSTDSKMEVVIAADEGIAIEAMASATIRKTLQRSCISKGF